MKVRDYDARHADGQTPPMSTRAPAACGVLRVTWMVVETGCAHVCAFELGHVARHVSTAFRAIHHRVWLKAWECWLIQRSTSHFIDTY